MMRKGERNNGGLLTAWAFYLSGELVIALMILGILNSDLWQEALPAQRRKSVLNMLCFFCLYILLGWSNPFVKEYSFLLMLASNISLYLPYLQKGRIAFRDICLWLLLGFGFYTLALFLPESMLPAAERLRALWILAILFLPHAFAMVIHAFMDSSQEETLLKNTRMKKSMLH